MSYRKCTSNHIAYDSKKNRYIVYVKGKTINYSLSRYGEFAKILAERSLESGIRYNDHFEDNGDGTTTFYINTKTYGVKEVIVDSEDAVKLFGTKISVAKDLHAYTFYASTKYGKLHRTIMGVTDSKDIVDHIDRNGLNNSKKNLRIVNVSLNNRNANVRKDNKSGYRGILECENRFRVYYYNELKKKCSKSFSKIKYGVENALKMALDFREMVYDEYGYIA